MHPKLRVAGTLAATGLLCWMGCALSLDQYGAQSTVDGEWDLIIVAGCRVQPNGAPSLALQRRVDKALGLVASGAASTIVFTGGVGTHGDSEGSVAASYAVAHGLPETAAFIEDQSTSTEENARFAALHFPAERVLVVSDAYHIMRIERVFGRYYPTVHGVGSTASAWERTRGSMREVLAIGWYGVTGRL